MSEPAWKHFVESLKDRNFESPYLRQLEARLNGPLAIKGVLRPNIEQEIIDEMAFALRQAEEKLTLALLRVDVAAAEIDQATDAATRRERIEQFNTERDKAARIRWEFVVHREALGLTRHDVLKAMYPIPPKKRIA